MIWLDEYERRARLAPGLLMLAPLAFTVAALGLRTIPVVSIAAAVLTGAGGPVVLAGYVRRRGLQTQKELWSQWGGPPTSAALRHQSSYANPAQRDRWRTAVAAATGLVLPSAEDEAEDLSAADASIDIAVGELRELTRGSGFPLVTAENKNYGFQRNLFAIRSAGRTVGATCLAVVVFALVVHKLGHASGLQGAGLVAAVVLNLGLLLAWVLMPSADQVRDAADKYAYQLMQAATTLPRASSAISTAEDKQEL